MKKTKLFKLSIPAPCHENWENMTPNEHGRHCTNCNKTVIDFSLYTDKQLVEFFEKIKDNVCGRLNRFQLDRELVYIEPKNHFLYKLLFGVTFTAGLAGSANGNNNYPDRHLTGQSRSVVHNELYDKESDNITGGDTTHYIKGRLLNTANGHMLPNATVFIKGSSESTQSDSLGYFKLPIPASYDFPEITLIVDAFNSPAAVTTIKILGEKFPIIKNVWVHCEENMSVTNIVAGNIIPNPLPTTHDTAKRK